jgi:hypothetical protein
VLALDDKNASITASVIPAEAMTPRPQIDASM